MNDLTFESLAVVLLKIKIVWGVTLFFWVNGS
jgi:hypothetical protein